jgi:hypothetical protein
MTVTLMVAFLAAAHGSTIVTPTLVNFDLAKVRTREPTCIDRGQSDEIIVCAPKGMDIWISDLGRFAARPIRAEFTGPLNAESTVHVIQHGSPIGVAPAAAVTLKWRF